METAYTIIGGRAWYCISIFYARKAWLDLTVEITSFYYANESLLDCCLIYLSEERGEHIRITFSSKADNINMVQNKIENHFLLFLKNTPSTHSKEFPFGKELWSYYPNNSLVWNRYKMRYQNMDLSFDKQLVECLSGFQNSNQAENKEQVEEKAFQLLEQIQQEVAVSPHEIRLAKWGCLVAYLVRHSFVEAEVDELLAETDERLISLWQEMEVSYVDISQVFLWMGDYFLFRYCDKQSKLRSRSFQILEKMLHCIEQLFHKPEHSEIYVEPIFLFPTSVWQEMEWWLLRINEYCLSESVRRVLNNLYALRDSEVLLHSNSPKDALRCQLRNGYFSK